VASPESQQIRAAFVNDRETLDVPLDIQRQEWEAGAAQVQLPPDIAIVPADAGGVPAEWVMSPARLSASSSRATIRHKRAHDITTADRMLVRVPKLLGTTLLYSKYDQFPTK
jgi:hypothetical protein